MSQRPIGESIRPSDVILYDNQRNFCKANQEWQREIKIIELLSGHKQTKAYPKYTILATQNPIKNKK
jgi:hypothetical protein